MSQQESLSSQTHQKAGCPDACHHGDLGRHDRADVICVDNVSFAYRHGYAGTPAATVKQVLDSITLHVERGCNLGIVGPNGAGKTTLLKCILGLLEGYTGSIQIMGMSPYEACRTGKVLGYVPQRHEVEWRFPLSVRQVVRMGLTTKTGLFKRYSQEDLDYLESLMHRLDIESFADRPIGDLSGGQQQRVFIARALAARPPLLVLDEPTVGVDEGGRDRFAKLIRELHAELSLTIVLVSHDLRAIAASCHRVACLNQSIHYHDAPEGLTEDVLREVFQHDIAPFIAEERDAKHAGN